MIKIQRSFLLLLLLWCPLLITAQTGPKVGLVLSGGGARGYAHIGALQVLEEAGVRIDYIGGTSMGSIVGGLTAAGYSATQLEKMLRETDILGVLQDAIDRENRTIYEKRYDEHYLIGLSLKDFAIQLPTALSDGQRIHDLFSHWTANVHQTKNFSELPIPFLCVGTDIGNGEAVVIESGKLADAMRASAALPGLISPYEIDGRIMTDGGLSNNYPAEEVKRKGMDYVIGITVEQDALGADDITSLDQLLLQIAFFQSTRRNVRQYEVTDVDIKPDLDGFTQLSFEAIDDLVEAGRVAARAFLPTLDSLAALQQPVASRDTAVMEDSLRASIVEITGNNDLSRRQVLSFFDGQLPGTLSWEDFRTGLVALYATGRYANIDYEWEEIPGQDGVRLRLQLKQSPDFGQQLRLGLHYDEVYRANILVGLTLSDVLLDNTNTTIDLIGGDRFRYRFDYRYNKVDGSSLGLRSRLHYVEFEQDIDPVTTSDGLLTFERVDFRFTDLNAELYWDLLQTKNSFTGIATELKYYQANSTTVAAAEPSTGFRLGDDNYLIPKIYFLYDKLDDQNFPLAGFRINARARAIWNLGQQIEAEDQWTYNGDLEFTAFQPLSERFSLGLELAAGGFLNRSALPYRYYLGSNNRNLMNNFKLFPGLKVGRASGDNLLMGELMARYNPGGGHFFTAGFRSAELGNAEGLPSSVDRDLLLAGRLSYGFSSPLGPLELTYARGNVGWEFYVNLGHWF